MEVEVDVVGSTGVVSCDKLLCFNFNCELVLGELLLTLNPEVVEVVNNETRANDLAMEIGFIFTI